MRKDLLWYRKAYRIPLRKSLKSYRGAIFLRIIDANLNRSREGLRVCEEIVRFILEDARLTSDFKHVRHKITRTIKKSSQLSQALLESRNTQTDVGKSPQGKLGRKNSQEVFFANIQRVKESLRVLEEFSKIFNRSLSSDFAKMRFKIYELEKRTFARF